MSSIIFNCLSIARVLRCMFMQFMTVKEASLNWACSGARIRIWLAQGRIPGASKLGRDWVIPSSATRPSIENKQFFVYTYRDAEGNVLYVGCSHDPYITRARLHKDRSVWFASAYSIVVSDPMEKSEALRAERDAIVALRPLYNRTKTKPFIVRVPRIAKDGTVYVLSASTLASRVRKAFVLNMREDGMSLQEIADCFDVSRQRIHQIVSKLNMD